MTTGSDKPTKKTISKKAETASKEEEMTDSANNVEQVIGIIEKMSVLE
jgi:hypothetical protein